MRRQVSYGMGWGQWDGDGTEGYCRVLQRPMTTAEIIKDHHFTMPRVVETTTPYVTKPGRSGNGHVASETATGEDW